MISTFDWIVIVFLALIGLSGFIKGFFLTILGPLNLILSLLVSWIFFQHTQHLPLTILMALFAPFIIALLFRIFKGLLIRDTNVQPSLYSQIAGSFFGILWGVGWIIAFLFIYHFLASTSLPAQQVIENSKTYQFYLHHTSIQERFQPNNLDEKKQILQNFLQNNPLIQTLQEKNYIPIPIPSSDSLNTPPNSSLQKQSQ